MNTAYFHACRSSCQAAKLLYSHLPKHRSLPSALDYGGNTLEDNQYVPIMMTLDPMPDVLVDDITCNYKTDCLTKRCKYKNVPMNCSVLCHKILRYNSESCQNKSE